MREDSRTCKSCGKLKPITAFRHVQSRGRKPYTLRRCEVCEKIARAEYDHTRRPKRIRRNPNRRPTPTEERQTELYRAVQKRCVYRRRLKAVVAKLEDLDTEIQRLRGNV